MAARPRHPKKEIEDAIQYAESKGWTCKLSKKGHAWGRIYCRHHTRDGCHTGVWSTPQNSGDHANGLKRYVDRCPHVENEEGQTDEKV